MTTEPRGLDWLQGQFERLIELSEADRARYLAELSRNEPQVASRLQRMLAVDSDYACDDSDAPATVFPTWTTKLPEIPGYRLLDLAGSGGMGQVFRAIREDDAQQVVRAVKVLRLSDSHPLAKERFEAECRVLAALDHPCIARYIASGVSELGQPFVVMEYIDGDPIEQWCDGRRLGLNQRVELVRDLLAAVQHAHQRLIVHRDIKGGNVLVDSTGKLSLVDFGIAKQLTADSSLESTATAARFLSLLSAAPEQLNGKPISTATDVYAIGMLLYRLLCGRDPFSDGDDMSPLEFQRRVTQIPAPAPASRIQSGDQAVAHARGFSSPRDLQRDLRADLTNVVLRCLRKTPGERYASVGALDRDLKCVLDGLPISERESEPVYRLRKFVGRHRGKVAAVTLSVALLCATLVAALQQRANALRERDRAEAVVGVLKDAFAAANPLAIGGGEIRVREVLDAAGPMLQDLKATQPDVFIELAATMAEVELSAGRASTALALTSQATELLRSQIAPDSTLVARLDHLDAVARLDSGDLDGLQERIDRLTAPTRAASAERSLLQGRLAYLQTDVAGAVELLQAAAGQADSLAADDPLRLRIDLHLAQAYRLAEDDQAAAAQLDAALQRLSALHAEDHPRVLLVRMRQLEFAQRTRPLAELRAEATALLAQIDRVFGDNSELAARLSGLLAFMNSRDGQNEESIGHFRRSWQAWATSTSAGHPNTLRALFNLTYMSGRGDAATDDVLSLYRRLFDDARGGGELSPVIISYWRISQVEFLVQRQRCAQALRLAEAHFSDPMQVALNPPSQVLLHQTMDAAAAQCACSGTEPYADPSCPSVDRVRAAIGTPAPQKPDDS